MSKTPRTEKEIIKTLGLSVQHALSSMKDFARQLETELAEARADAEHRKGGLTGMIF